MNKNGSFFSSSSFLKKNVCFLILYQKNWIESNQSYSNQIKQSQTNVSENSPWVKNKKEREKERKKEREREKDDDDVIRQWERARGSEK